MIIEQSGHRVNIENHCDSTVYDADDLGFDLGLELTQKLIAQYGWYYHHTDMGSGGKVSVVFGDRDIGLVSA
ncbi:hypothetical protein CXF80_15660 [Shewanella sp. Actino-trap-3]|uniref:hypothetical protein n=1 Tax=Shewanella sp. Actino-trap-3 TaxID=2058331 RepID=UPI000C34934B|nr:hypothetical protein [Shewanella sp. Actino-trap-3]PKG79630.1 hypothetical protein CXF80_15660 [Shewanella sp. Actino-trap-3]